MQETPEEDLSLELRVGMRDVAADVPGLRSDEYTSEKALTARVRAAILKLHSIDVDGPEGFKIFSSAGIVELYGLVSSPLLMKAVVYTAESVAGVQVVVNNMQVKDAAQP